MYVNKRNTCDGHFNRGKVREGAEGKGPRGNEREGGRVGIMAVCLCLAPYKETVG